MSTSILTTIKTMLGPEETYTHFDSDLVIHINTVISALTQMGVGPTEGFEITGPSETWDQFVTDSKRFNSVKTYIYLKVRLIFDPPSSSTVIEAFNRSIEEIEWRLTVATYVPLVTEGVAIQ